MKVRLTLELRDVHPQYADVPYAFIGYPPVLSRTDAEKRVGEAGIGQERIADVLELLLWFGFLGIEAFPEGEGTPANSNTT